MMVGSSACKRARRRIAPVCGDSDDGMLGGYGVYIGGHSLEMVDDAAERC
jgi:hypothetical protein